MSAQARALLLPGLLLACLSGPVRADTYFLTVAGLGGEADYEQRFTRESQDLERILATAGPALHVRTLQGLSATRDQVSAALQAIATEAHPEDTFVLVLIGHGSHDGLTYKLNLPGPDISAGELAQACNRIPAKRQLVVDTTSASGGAIPELARAGRAVIAATKSGTEKNAPVFARFFIEALADPAADVNKDETISALEAFEYATAKTAAYYESQKRLATEHAVFDDLGGTAPPARAAEPAGGAGHLLGSLTLVRLGGEASAAASPERLRLLARKDVLLTHIDTLKVQRAALPPEEYKRALTESLLQLARVQQELDKPAGAAASSSSSSAPDSSEEKPEERP